MTLKRPLVATAMLVAYYAFAHANGISDNGVGARSQAMGGADVAWASDPLGAMGVNPAGLAFQTSPVMNLGGVGGFLNGHFSKSNEVAGNLDTQPQALPEGAFAMPVGQLPIVIGISFVPQSMDLVKWNYADAPGGLGGVSYGAQNEKSEIINLRSSLGIAGQITSTFAMGASVGLIYNKNELNSPYIFQNLQSGNSGLNGAKTLLNLQTEGLGWNAQVGFLWKITPDVQVGLSYESPTKIVGTGDAWGDASTQFGQPIGTLPFHYDATVTDTLPQEVRGGVSWKFLPQWRLSTQIDWIDWEGSFSQLPMTFRNGSNSTVNGALGSSFTDNVPLNWKSEFVYRAGVEYDVTPDLALRAGYCYGNSPVPDSTLTPLNAAIFQHTFTCGVGYHWDRYRIDAAYQYYLPASQSVGQSGLQSGEYSNSTTTVSAHEFAVTTSVEF
jgi:long-chain fatty acid transport protein